MKQSITIHAEGKIDIHARQKRYQDSLKGLEQDKDIIQANKELILSFLADCELGKTIRGKAKRKIGAGRCLKYLGILRRLSGIFGKSFNEVSQQDMEKLIRDLEDNSIKAKCGKAYSEATKGDIKKAIKKFWKWKDGANKIYPEVVDWIDTYISVNEIPALSKAEVEQMLEVAPSARDRALIMVLFDSGARAEELLNVRIKAEHVFWKEEYGCYMLRLEFSKTKPRTVSLPLSSGHLRNWLKAHPAKEDPLAQLFPMTYAAMKMVVYRAARRALNKRVTPHVLRHSSATYYANRLKNTQKMCYRYGWTMASKEVNRYVDREGILEFETTEAVRQDETGKALKVSARLQEELTLMKEAHSQLAERFREVSVKLEELRDGKGLLALLMTALHKERMQKQDKAVAEKEELNLAKAIVKGIGETGRRM